MAESRQNYEMLKGLPKNEGFRGLSEKVLEMQLRPGLYDSHSEDVST